MIFVVLDFLQTSYKMLKVEIEKKNNRISVLQMLSKIGVVRNFGKHTRKHLCQSLFLMKLHVPSM